jgi:mannose-6-phosphate isomerase-like protein (cupin superfamily)
MEMGIAEDRIMDAVAKVVRLAESKPISFGPLAHYQKLTGDDGLPVFTGVQTCRPGYRTPLHSHPYVEYLFIIQGTAEAWLAGDEDKPVRLESGDMIALPAGAPHAFRNASDGELRLLGIHCSPTRIVDRLEHVQSD